MYSYVTSSLLYNLGLNLSPFCRNIILLMIIVYMFENILGIEIKVETEVSDSNELYSDWGASAVDSYVLGRPLGCLTGCPTHFVTNLFFDMPNGSTY